MSEPAEFMQRAHQCYVAANRAALYWQLGRMHASSPLIDTKLNSITLQDYQAKDGLRGPDYIYCWIQGRGLEAMVVHAEYFRSRDPALSQALDSKARALYQWLKALYRSGPGVGFCLDSGHRAICSTDPSGRLLQQRDDAISTYSDLFVVKGLIAAAAHYFPDELPAHVEALQSIVSAIDQQRFLLCEAAHITEQALAVQCQEYGPKMIALGAAALLWRLSIAQEDAFSSRFVDAVSNDHFDAGSGLLRSEIQGHICNIGHCIEFAGFALEILQQSPNGCNVSAAAGGRLHFLVQLILTAFRHGFNTTGLVLTLDLRSLLPDNEICPWWSLPETIRAAALAFELSELHHAGQADALLQVWQDAHEAFFTHYWRTEPPLAFQSIGADGPLDFVPATPDLDPGYHTGLSLLGAIEMIERRYPELAAV